MNKYTLMFIFALLLWVFSPLIVIYSISERSPEIAILGTSLFFIGWFGTAAYSPI